MDEYVYTRTDLGRDYMRALIGLAVCVAPFIWLTPAIYFTVLMLAMAAVFALLLWQTAKRQFTRIVTDAHGITLIAFTRRSIAWDELSFFQLSYFTTWKALNGFMELKLKGPGVTMHIGSGLIGFRNVAKAGAEAAYRNHLTFKAATLENLKHLNIADPRLDPADDADNDGERRHG
jgi:hypothetical protein